LYFVTKKVVSVFVRFSPLQLAIIFLSALDNFCASVV
jgi:hypothetical protein